MKKKINIAYSAGKLDSQKEFLESVFEEKSFADFWSAKNRVLKHLNEKYPEFFKRSQESVAFEVFDYMTELLCILIDSDAYEIESKLQENIHK